MIKLVGRIDRQNIGPATWALITDNGDIYELHKPPQDLRQLGLQVVIQGQIREDVMSLAMIGPILEVTNFEIVNVP